MDDMRSTNSLASNKCICVYNIFVDSFFSSFSSFFIIAAAADVDLFPDQQRFNLVISISSMRSSSMSFFLLISAVNKAKARRETRLYSSGTCPLKVMITFVSPANQQRSHSFQQEFPSVSSSSNSFWDLFFLTSR